MGPEHIMKLARRRFRTEAEFSDAVVEAAHWGKWHVAHFGVGRNLTDHADGSASYATQTRYDAKGFPDLLLVHTVHPHLIWFRELKLDATRSRFNDDQIRWRDVLRSAGHNYDVWTPSMWDDIVQALGVGRMRVGA